MLSFADMLMGKDLMTRDVDDGPGEPVTFLSLKYKLVDLMIMAVQCETDSYNTQMLLGKYHGVERWSYTSLLYFHAYKNTNIYLITKGEGW